MVRVSDYIADFLVSQGVTDIFAVTGGSAMYLNDSFGHHPGLKCTYNHHEQASAIAAEAYARVNNQIAVVCTSTGPGATNAITGCLCGYMDSIPMVIISGQVRYATTTASSGLPLRTMGIQEYDIVKSVRAMTKYAEMISDPSRIRYCLEKAFFVAQQGRPGPVWLDIPLDVQGAFVNPDALPGFDRSEYAQEETMEVCDAIVEHIVEKVATSIRPVLYVGSGVRRSGGYELFLELVEKLNIPVVTGMSSVDAIHTDHSLYVGRGGNTGDRAGNYAIQNSDLFISLGSRLGLMQTGFNYTTWARAAYKIVNDIDPYELKKPNIQADVTICCDVKVLMEKLVRHISHGPLFGGTNWLEQCQLWKRKYPVVSDRHYSDPHANVYAFFHELTSCMHVHDDLIVSAGTSRVAGSQASIIKRGQRFYANPSAAAMGYCLPASIGVCTARGKKRVICVTGEGSLQMNIQELQTIIHNRLPIIIFVINNGGYHSIRQTQKTYFREPLVGVGNDSGDISFPDLSRLAPAYGFAYECMMTNRDVRKKMPDILRMKDPVICEVFVSDSQWTEPKVASKRLKDGSIVSAPLEDMAPFLSREELTTNMYIPLVDEEKERSRGGV